MHGGRDAERDEVVAAGPVPVQVGVVGIRTGHHHEIGTRLHQQAGEFGLTRQGQRLVGFFVNITDIKALGLPTAQGVVSVDAWYWDQDEETRAFARRFAERHRGLMPTQYQAGVYSAVRHWLKAIEAAGTDEAMAVAAKMRELPVNDVFAKEVWDGFAENVREDEALAQQFGIQGVPFFVFDRRYGLSGAQPADVMLTALERAWAEAVNLQA